MPPDNREVFAASFRFITTGTPTTPVAQRGLTPPANWGNGIRNSKFEWSTLNPNGSGWSTQVTDPLLVGASTAKSGQYRANGNPFTINVFGYTQNAPITSPIVQVSAFTTSDDTPNGTPTYINPPLAGYVWGLYDDNSTLLTIPARGTASMVTFTPASDQSFSLYMSGGPDEFGNAIYLNPLISFVFAPNLRGLVASGGKIFLDIAIYLSLNNVQCYDDPEMEVDLGSN